MENFFLFLMSIPAVLFIVMVGVGITVVLALMLNFVRLCIVAAISKDNTLSDAWTKTVGHFKEVFYFIFPEV